MARSIPRVWECPPSGMDEPLPAVSINVEIPVLTRQMQAGNEAAYREFYQRYFHRLLRYLFVVTHGQEDVARDALQAALLRVVRYIKPFESEEVFWSWLTVLARSAAADLQRKEIRHLGLLQRFFRHRPAPSEPNIDSDAELDKLLGANLAALTEDERVLIQRKYFERQSVATIAATLGLTEKAVDSRLVRVRRKLKTLILAQLHDPGSKL